MDVKKCWSDLCNAFNDHRRDEFDARAKELLQWLDEDGDPPTMYGIGNRATAVWMTRILCKRMRQRLRDSANDA